MSKKPLDRRAYFIVGFFFALAALALALRFIATYKIDKGPIALAIDRSDRSWIATTHALIALDADGQVIANDALKSLGVNQPTADIAIRGDDEAWLLGNGGALTRCKLESQLRCESVALGLSTQPQSGKLAFSEDGKLAAIVDNFRDEVVLIEIDTHREIARSTSTAALSNPNRPALIGDALMVANTGAHRIDAWTKNESTNQFDLAAAPKIVKQTTGQVYFFERTNEDEWITIEAGSMLANGKLRYYGKGQKQAETLPVSLADPVSFGRQRDGRLVVAGLSDNAIVALDRVVRDGQSSRYALNKGFGDAFARARAPNMVEAARWKSLMNASLPLMIAFFVAPIVILLLLGYALDQPIGKQVPDDPTKRAHHARGIQSNSVPTFELDQKIVARNLRKQMWIFGALFALFAAFFLLLVRDFRLSLLFALLGGGCVAVIWRVGRNARGRLKIMFLARELIVENKSGTHFVPYSEVWMHTRGATVAGLYASDEQLLLGNAILRKAIDVQGIYEAAKLHVPVAQQTDNLLRVLWGGMKQGRRWGQLGIASFAVAFVVILLQLMQTVWRLF